jgi:hypothetical protein
MRNPEKKSSNEQSESYFPRVDCLHEKLQLESNFHRPINRITGWSEIFQIDPKAINLVEHSGSPHHLANKSVAHLHEVSLRETKGFRSEKTFHEQKRNQKSQILVGQSKNFYFVKT